MQNEIMTHGSPSACEAGFQAQVISVFKNGVPWMGVMFEQHGEELRAHFTTQSFPRAKFEEAIRLLAVMLDREQQHAAEQAAPPPLPMAERFRIAEEVEVADTHPESEGAG